MRTAHTLAAILVACALTGAGPAFAQAPNEAPPPAAAPQDPPAAAAPAPPPAVAPVAPAAEAATLMGMAAWNAIIGNTVSGKREGEEFDFYVKADGTIVLLDDGDIESGKWAMEGQKVCLTFPDEPKECLGIEVIGTIVTFREDNGSGFRGNLVKGNPKKL